eukprot:GHVH01003819.1.p1 GENE.GHVH01003819.1~~GHVH01003819.1.p1  ORF type:complete len:556 (+),score=81.04 GHVH01003819.1:27-1670(+)
MFSGAVKLGDLDDYLGAAQDCIVELFQEKDDKGEKDEVVKRRELVDIDFSTEILKGDKPDLIKNDGDGVGKISLYDCLACSGCVTTAEVRLLDSQSISFFNDLMISRKYQSSMPFTGRDGLVALRLVKKIAVGISHSSLTALAVHYDQISDGVMFHKLTGFLETCNVDFVSSQSFGDASVLMLQRFDIDSTKLLTSHCPGWICFAEKTCTKQVVDSISTHPTAMVIEGHFIKEAMPLMEKLKAFNSIEKMYNSTRRWGEALPDIDMSTSDIAFVSVMPCYDKKLESLRPEFHYGEGSAVHPIVDLVIGTNEFIEWLDDHSFDPVQSYPKPLSHRDPFFCVNRMMSKVMGEDRYHYQPFALNRPFQHLIGGDGSGGMALYGLEDNKDKMMADGINSDFKLVKEGSVISASTAYGLRNLHNLSSMVDRGSLASLGGVVEAMACPSGCPLGGAHASLSENGHDGKSHGAKGTYKVLMKEMRENEGSVNMYTPQELPQVMVWDNYLKWARTGGGETSSEKVGIESWLMSVPRFKFKSLKSDTGPGSIDLNW